MSFETANILTITEEQLQHFNEHGYIRFDNLFKEEEIDPIRAIIDLMDEQSEQAIKNQGSADAISAAGKINFTSQLNFMHPDLQRFAADARFVALNTALLGPDVQLYWDQSVYKRPERTREFPWHQDNGYGPIEPMMYVTCWLALEDATIENGCVWIQPDSHKKGLVPHVKTDIGKLCYYGENLGIPVELKKGSMVAFHSLLFHRSGPNCSQATRKAYVLQYSVAGAWNPDTGAVFNNGPVIARGGEACYVNFQKREQC